MSEDDTAEPPLNFDARPVSNEPRLKENEQRSSFAPTIVGHDSPQHLGQSLIIIESALNEGVIRVNLGALPLPSKWSRNRLGNLGGMVAEPSN